MNLLRIILVVLVCVQANAANVRLGFRDNAGEIDTNALLVTKISTNILDDGGVLAKGIPRRLPYSPITNTLSIGRYSVSNLHLRSCVVIEVGDSSSTLYDMTNLLVGGVNTYVMRSLNINELTNTPGMLALLTNIASSAGGGAAVSAAELAVPSTNAGVVTITVRTNAVKQLTVAGSTNSVNATNLYPAAPLSVDFLGGTLTSGNSKLGPSGLAVNGGGALTPSGFSGSGLGLTNLAATNIIGTLTNNTTGNAAGASNLYGAAVTTVASIAATNVSQGYALGASNLLSGTFSLLEWDTNVVIIHNPEGFAGTYYWTGSKYTNGTTKAIYFSTDEEFLENKWVLTNSTADVLFSTPPSAPAPAPSDGFPDYWFPYPIVFDYSKYGTGNYSTKTFTGNPTTNLLSITGSNNAVRVEVAQYVNSVINSDSSQALGYRALVINSTYSINRGRDAAIISSPHSVILSRGGSDTIDGGEYCSLNCLFGVGAIRNSINCTNNANQRATIMNSHTVTLWYNTFDVNVSASQDCWIDATKSTFQNLHYGYVTNSHYSSMSGKSNVMVDCYGVVAHGDNLKLSRLTNCTVFASGQNLTNFVGLFVATNAITKTLSTNLVPLDWMLGNAVGKGLTFPTSLSGRPTFLGGLVIDSTGLSTAGPVAAGVLSDSSRAGVTELALWDVLGQLKGSGVTRTGDDDNEFNFPAGSTISAEVFNFGATVGDGRPTITSGSGAPASSPPNGSIYLRTDGSTATTLYVRISGVWVGK